jgi:hypothetical protein
VPHLIATSYLTHAPIERSLEAHAQHGYGQEDVFPICQFEKLWGDMSSLAEIECRFVKVPRRRGQQLKEQSQLDSWLRDGSAAYVEALCDWG